MDSTELAMCFFAVAAACSFLLKLLEWLFFSEPLLVPRPPGSLGFARGVQEVLRLPRISIRFERRSGIPPSAPQSEGFDLGKGVILSADYDKYELRVPAPPVRSMPASPMQAQSREEQKSKAEPLQINFEME
jgi:hypothetical protein